MIDFVSKIPLNKGWSSDKKYILTDKQGQKFLLRVGEKSTLERKKLVFACMKEFEKLGIPMCLPVDCGVFEEGAYSIQSYINGDSAEDIVPYLPYKKAYEYGLESGRILRKIHSLPAPEDLTDWDIYFNAKIDKKIELYTACPIKYDKGNVFIDFIQENRALLKNRAMCYQHGDYHIGNMIIAEDKRLYIIDFDRYDFGEPYEEFNRIVWCANASPAFAKGRVEGYFDGKVPNEFWALLKLYIATNTLSSLPWAIPFGEGEISTMKNQAENVLRWFNDFNSLEPLWYKV